MKPLPPRRQRGVSMIEALVSFLLLSIGLLAFVRVQGELRFASDVSRQRSEAVRLAEEHMEGLRSYATLASFDSSFTTLTSANTLTLGDANTSFSIRRTVTPYTHPDPDYRALAVTVEWPDRRGETRNVLLTTTVARLNPVLQGTLTIAPTSAPVRTPYERNVRIPLQAVNLSKTESGFVPPGQSDFFWVFNSGSAAIIKRCTFPPGTTTLAENDTNNAYRDADCTARPGYLVKGYVRFDTSNSPSVDQPAGNACRFYNRVHNPKVESSSDSCDTYATIADLLDVRMSADAGYSPDGLQPKSECFDDFPTAVRNKASHVNYYCAVYVQESGMSWEGKVRLVPKTSSPQWSFETKSPGDTFTAVGCRYSDDYNRNGNIDAPEHPHQYLNVAETLTSQNFLIVRGDKKCRVPKTVTIGNTTETISYRTCRIEPLPSTDKDHKRCDE